MIADAATAEGRCGGAGVVRRGDMRRTMCRGSCMGDRAWRCVRRRTGAEVNEDASASGAGQPPAGNSTPTCGRRLVLSVEGARKEIVATSTHRSTDRNTAMYV